MKTCFPWIFMFCLFVSSSPVLSGEFSREAARVTKTLPCSYPKLTAAESSLGWGKMYGCIAGPAETGKFFVNERIGTGKIKNIKLIWNDWFVDVGYGIHADEIQAREWVGSFSSLYAKGGKRELMEIFFGVEDRTLSLENYSLVFTYRRGPRIDERLFVLTPK